MSAQLVPTVLELGPGARADLERWARAGYPRESCGVLVGRVEDGVARALDAVRARNIVTERAEERFELDPGALVAAEADARARGLAILGVWHSHPDRAAEPSESDRASAWSGWAYLIVAVGACGVSEMRCWRLVEGRFREERLVRASGPAPGARAGSPE